MCRGVTRWQQQAAQSVGGRPISTLHCRSGCISVASGGDGDTSGQDKLVSEWDDFSSFMPTQRARSDLRMGARTDGGSSLDSILTPSITHDLHPQDSVQSTPSQGPLIAANPSADKTGKGITVSDPPVSAPPAAELPSQPVVPNGISTGSDKAPSSDQDISVDELLGLDGRKSA